MTAVCRRCRCRAQTTSSSSLLRPPQARPPAGGHVRFPRAREKSMGMICGSCGMANRDGARFCAGCGARLLRRCATCDVELADGARFCDACGAPVADAAGLDADVPTSPDQARKTVTVLFADLAGSTPMQEQMDPESVRA